MILATFIDGLKPESVEEYMEFLNTLYKARIKTELVAYSSVCDTSIYTGVFPNKHLCWFVWKYSPDSSPFKILNKIGLTRIPHNLYSKYICYKTCLWLNGINNPGIFSSPFLVDIPIKNWSYFDTDIKKSWEYPQFHNCYPNLFKILRTNNVQYEVVGVKPKDLPDSSRVVKVHRINRNKSFVNYFIGDIDHLSHSYGQDAPKTIERLKIIDKILEKKYTEYERIFNDFYFIIFSDHGHSEVKKVISLRKIFKKKGRKVQDYIHFIDSNYARFWFKNPKEKREVIRILSEISDKGFILTKKFLREYNVNMPDNRYGDLIFYLDKPYIFFEKEISALGRKVKAPVSMHGYLPDYPDSDAIFVSNKMIRKNKIILQDITPSILQLLGLEIPKYMDGEPIWKQSM